LTAAALSLRHLAFTGPNRTTAEVEFGAGLNVIFGASETGKSFILESIDFMLGGGEDLRDIPERVGYDRVWLGFESPEGKPYTLERAVVGGKYSLFEGLHKAVPASQKPVILNGKHNPQRNNNVSMFLLGLLGLSDKRIQKNARGETNSLSFRNLVHLCVVPEGDIQKRGSPIETGDYLTRTPEMSVFKLLVTGVDDSAVQPIDEDRTRVTSRAAKTEIIDELIVSLKDKLTSIVGEEDDVAELEEQLNKLEDALEVEKTGLQQLEFEFKEIAARRHSFRDAIDDADGRLAEIEELLARFDLLSLSYQSDLRRLVGLREAGSLLGALKPGRCPVCGASSEHQNPSDHDCDGNIEVVVAAADAETSKIRLLAKELADTVEQLNDETAELKASRPGLRQQLIATDGELSRITPTLRGQRATYSEITEKRTSVNTALSLFQSISDLEQRKAELEEDTSEPRAKSGQPASGLSESVLDRFSEHMRLLLMAWNFPETERVHFDRSAKDFVISGKPRGSRGKGMRAITHSAFNVSLLEFTRDNELPHPGFVVLDTPLLAYREPEHDEDDLSETDIRDHFYEYLSKHDDRQVIILENVTPSKAVLTRSQTTLFTKNEQIGRYGLFPRPATKRA
jgi:predicted  nucleic acid-binding Zn-ribbon protein